MSSDQTRNTDKIGLTSPNQTTDEVEVEVVRTYLAIENLAGLRPRPRPPSRPRLVPIDPCPVHQWRRLYADIGAPWKWHDRDAWSDETLAAHLARPTVRVFHLLPDEPAEDDRPSESSIPSAANTCLATAARQNESIGFLELERHDDGSVEIVYLGLHLRVMGVGIGAWFIAEAVRQAFTLGATRVWLHTCTLDSPAALPNYIARGFTPERTETYTARLRL